MEENISVMDPNYIPEDLKTPYDVVELPSQGLLYKNKKSKVKVEYLTAMDESILTSPNLSNSPNEMIDVLLRTKVKDLGFDVNELLEGDRVALLIFLRSTGIGEIYPQIVYDENSNDFVDGEINLNELKQKKLTIKPDENNEFDFTLPKSEKRVKFRLLTAKDENEIVERDKQEIKRSKNKISNKVVLRLESMVTEIDGDRSKIQISNILKKIPLLDSRKLRKYIDENEPGIDLSTTARIQGGGSVECFLRLGKNFFYPEL
jgi:hypothetical protein|tara:strand:- start:1533 stop:2315 length:783 start_codon:yes stop_codon:yes gene_type:complete